MYIQDDKGNCAYSNYFSIVNEEYDKNPPKINIIAPIKGNKLVLKLPYKITWQFSSRLIDIIKYPGENTDYLEAKIYKRNNKYGGLIVAKNFKDNRLNLLNFTYFEWTVGNVSCLPELIGPDGCRLYSPIDYFVLPEGKDYQMEICVGVNDRTLKYCEITDSLELTN